MKLMKSTSNCPQTTCQQLLINNHQGTCYCPWTGYRWPCHCPWIDVCPWTLTRTLISKKIFECSFESFDLCIELQQLFNRNKNKKNLVSFCNHFNSRLGILSYADAQLNQQPHSSQLYSLHYIKHLECTTTNTHRITKIQKSQP